MIFTLSRLINRVPTILRSTMITNQFRTMISALNPKPDKSRCRHNRLQAAILDWSGTTTDKYVIAPAVVFKDVFNKYGVDITMEEAREPMGLKKDLHIKALTEMPSVKEKWNKVYKRNPTQEDVDNMFEDFVPMQLECLPKYTELLPETIRVVEKLRNNYNLKIGITTGFTRKMVDVLLDASKEQGFVPDVNVAGDEVENGARPSPHMVYKNMDLLGVNKNHFVVKVDDTVSGVGEAVNAGCWGVGIARYSNYMNINSYEFEKNLHRDEINKKLIVSRDKLKKSGAHYVIDTLDDLPDVIDDINMRLKNGETP